MLSLSKRLILASGSERRRKLLSQIGLAYEIRVSDADETMDPALSPEVNAMRLAERKARIVVRDGEDVLILGADTMVVHGTEVLNKPADRADAHRMLALLSGSVHEVVTGVTLFETTANACRTEYERTRVKFRDIPDAEIEKYIDSGSPMDKAGAYGIQDDYGATFATRIEGCFYNVVGLPLARLYAMLEKYRVIA